VPFKTEAIQAAEEMRKEESAYNAPWELKEAATHNPRN